MSGIWEEKKSDPKIFHQYWFQKEIGHLTELKMTKKKGEFEVVLDNPAEIIIIKNENGFEIKYNGISSNWISKLKYLNSSKMILITDEIETEYTKIPN